MNRLTEKTIVKYNGETYFKIPDRGFSCKKCHFYDRKEHACCTPDGIFDGCEVGRFFWKKENER